MLVQLQDSTEEYLTMYVRSSSFSRYSIDLAVELGPFADEVTEALSTDAVFREVQRYGTGLVIFWSQSKNRLIVLPPFDITEDRVVRGSPDTYLLNELLSKAYILGVVLVTWGSYAVGVFEGDALVESKTGTGYIHKRHRKGGRSEKRFARRTVEQKNDFLRKVANRVEDKFSGYTLEQIFFGGNRLILKPLLEESHYLKYEAHHISNRFLNVRYADRDALLKSLEDVNRSLIFRYQ